MRVYRTLSRLGIVGLALYAAAGEVFRSSGRPAETSRAPSKIKLIVRTVVLTVIACLVLGIAGGLLFAVSGLYPIAADRPHFAPVRWLLQTGRTRSVQFYAHGIQVPDLREHSLLPRGFMLYRKNCQPCHGAPGVAPEAIGLGINPKPPQLVTVQTDWSASELYWITSRGLKMSGMPAFAPRLSDHERWAIVAFVRRLSRLSPADYQGLMAAADLGIEPTNWGVDDDSGFARIQTGDRANGRRLLSRYGCTSCHTIPEIGWGHVGPPLTGFAERQYIAGFLVNVPTNTMNWIMDPRKYKPQTAMPKLGVKDHEAVDIAAYLYSLGSPKRIALLRPGQR